MKQQCCPLQGASIFEELKTRETLWTRAVQLQFDWVHRSQHEYPGNLISWHHSPVKPYLRHTGGWVLIIINQQHSSWCSISYCTCPSKSLASSKIRGIILEDSAHGLLISSCKSVSITNWVGGVRHEAWSKAHPPTHAHAARLTLVLSRPIAPPVTPSAAELPAYCSEDGWAIDGSHTFKKHVFLANCF